MTEPQRFFSRTGLFLWLAAIFGVICVFPYALALAPESIESAAQQLGVPTSAAFAISIIQSALILGLMTYTGLWAAGKLGLGAPLVEALVYKRALPYKFRLRGVQAIALGVAAALLIAGLDLLVFSTVLESLEIETQVNIAVWKGFAASFYGGITEEIQLRLFLLSFVALGLRYIVGLVSGARDAVGLSAGVFWTANVIAAVAFGLGHLPATAELMPLTPLVLARAIVLNGVVGLVAGYLYWRRGIEMAMLCHFSADIVLHVLIPLLS